MMMCLGVGLFASILFGTLCASWTCLSIFFTKLGKLSLIIFSNRFPISCSFSSPSGTPMKRVLNILKLSQRLLILSSFFWIPFSACCPHCFLLLMFQIINLILGSTAFSCKLFFISIGVFFVSDQIFFMLLRSSLSSLSILITSV